MHAYRRRRVVRWTAFAAVATLAASVLLSACSTGAPTIVGPSPTPDPVCGDAPPGSQVVLYTAPGLEYWYSDVLATFESDCDVSIYYAELTSAQLLQRLTNERSRPLSDIVVMQPPYISDAATLGLLGGTDVPEAASVPSNRCGHNRIWCTIVENYTSWVYNPVLIRQSPMTWQDLLTATFKGKVLTSRPDRAEDGLAMLTLLDVSGGESAALAYLTKLESATSAHYTLTDTMSRLVAAGVDLAANGNLAEDLNDIDQYHNVAVWFPSFPGEGPTTLAVPFGAALVHDDPNPVSARALLNFMWSKQGQDGTGLSNSAPGRPDVVPTDGRSLRLRAMLKGVHILRIDWDAMAATESRLLMAWLPLVHAPDGTALPTSPTPMPALPPSPPPG
jgi:2-aminoethylphosphonate transport system substrate-binding protein